MWFRSDLRIRDNTALQRACGAGDAGVIGVFAICPRQWSEHDWGAMKVDFVLRNVAALSDSLAERNIPLLVTQCDTFDEVPAKLLTLARRHRCTGIHFNREYEVNELRRDEAVTTLFRQSGLEVHAHTDQVIVDVGRLRTGAGDWYSVFTPFKRKWLQSLDESGPPKVRPRPPRQASLDVSSDDVPGSIRRFSGHTRPDLWPAGEKAARQRLKAFVGTRIERYEVARDFPAEYGTSELSPYLAAGVLSPRQCLEAALESNEGRLDSGQEGVTTWINELIWREFYRHVLMGFPQVCMDRPFREETDRVPWRHDESLFEAWREGRTGVPLVDAGMRQLAETGWMHNRLRMVTAMYLTKDLLVDWRWGQSHFMRHLVDGDFASNNGGWQWSASTGTDAAPYFRIFNPAAQSRRYDPEGAFIRRYVPELCHLPAKSIHEPHKMAGPPANYPTPLVDHARAVEQAKGAFRRL
jgi:deoxyribodipyrimidine photo-lyase